jgi:hypothetical protein
LNNGFPRFEQKDPQGSGPRFWFTDLWWHDCSAQALGEQYRGFTFRVCKASSANAAAEPDLQPGDLGVTASGVHVLAYLGEREWIQAEPTLLQVVPLQAPNENGWMNQPLHIMRWTMMTETDNPAPKIANPKLAEPHNGRSN